MKFTISWQTILQIGLALFCGVYEYIIIHHVVFNYLFMTNYFIVIYPCHLLKMTYYLDTIIHATCSK